MFPRSTVAWTFITNTLQVFRRFYQTIWIGTTRKAWRDERKYTLFVHQVGSALLGFFFRVQTDYGEVRAWGVEPLGSWSKESGDEQLLTIWLSGFIGKYYKWNLQFERQLTWKLSMCLWHSFCKWYANKFNGYLSFGVWLVIGKPVKIIREASFVELSNDNFCVKVEKVDLYWTWTLRINVSNTFYFYLKTFVNESKQSNKCITVVSVMQSISILQTIKGIFS